ncbi:MAG TPA: hypothetical protein PK919_02820 [Candidatus Aminicenantes bacterium]|nr:hypothetical protein [Candidatus Aminicenantes bacterium]
MNRRHEPGRHERHDGTTTVIPLILLLASFPLLAARRRGATVEVWMIDGARIRGELLSVRNNMLVVHDRQRDSGAVLDARDVDEVRILKKPRWLAGVAFGALVGAAAGAVLCGTAHDGDGGEQAGAVVMALKIGGLAMAAGGLIGAHGPPVMVVRFSGLTAEGIESGLRGLQPLARCGGDAPCPGERTPRQRPRTGPMATGAVLSRA